MSLRYIVLLLTVVTIGMIFLPANAAQLDVAIPKNSEKILPTYQLHELLHYNMTTQVSFQR